MYYYNFIPLLMCIIIFGCGTDSDPKTIEWEGQWKEMGMESHVIRSVEIADENILVADQKNIYRKPIKDNFRDWPDISIDIHPNASGIADLLYVNGKIYATAVGVDSEIPDDFVTLYISNNEGEDWEGIEISLENTAQPYQIWFIAYSPEIGFFCSHRNIYKSEDIINWTNLTKSERKAATDFLYISPEFPNQIWFGGENNVGTGNIFKSNDGGLTWENIAENMAISNGYYGLIVFDIIISPNNENSVLAGAKGLIKKSEDAGENWYTVLEGYEIYKLENSDKYNGRVYASGYSIVNRNLFVAVSEDSGETWIIEENPDSPENILVNDMAVAMEDGEEVVYLGTNKGVYGFKNQ